MWSVPPVTRQDSIGSAGRAMSRSTQSTLRRSSPNCTSARHAGSGSATTEVPTGTAPLVVNVKATVRDSLVMANPKPQPQGSVNAVSTSALTAGGWVVPVVAEPDSLATEGGSEPGKDELEPADVG